MLSMVWGCTDSKPTIRPRQPLARISWSNSVSSAMPTAASAAHCFPMPTMPRKSSFARLRSRATLSSTKIRFEASMAAISARISSTGRCR